MKEALDDTRPGCSCCCTGPMLHLNRKEYEHLRSNGTELEIVLSEHIDHEGNDLRAEYLASVHDRINEFSSDPALLEKAAKLRSFALDLAFLSGDEEVYSVIGDCGLLEDGRCSDYDNRPRDCRELEVGSSACLGFRERGGITETSVDFC